MYGRPSQPPTPEQNLGWFKQNRVLVVKRHIRVQPPTSIAARCSEGRGGDRGRCTNGGGSTLRELVGFTAPKDT